MTLYQWFTILGLPTISGLVIKILFDQIKFKAETRKEYEHENRNIRDGVKALLRSQMIQDYNRYYPRRYAPIYAKENFENCYKQYHNLGGNGVMDDLREKFLDLPTEER